MLPLWSLLSLAAALVITAMPLLQEKFKADTYALAFWIKVFMAALIAPYALYVGLPDTWQFYVFTGLTAVLYAFSDINYFRAVPIVGSGIITRILPASVVITFFAWFAVDPALLKAYAAQPWKIVTILGILALFTFCATHVKKCHLSWQGVKLIWFVLFAACIGPVITKLGLNHVSKAQGASSYIFIQGIMTVILLGVFYAWKKPVATSVLLSRHSIQTAFLISLFAVINVFLKTTAVQLVDNPAYVSMILFSDSLWVLLIYKMIGRKENANVWASLGIVLCALLVVVVKTL